MIESDRPAEGFYDDVGQFLGANGDTTCVVGVVFYVFGGNDGFK